MRKRKYTDQEFIQAVQKSKSIRQTLVKLGLNAAGRAYLTLTNFYSLPSKTTSSTIIIRLRRPSTNIYV